MSKRDWTPPQKNAIEARGGTILVAAAAGSGKTAVLVERICSYITNEENPIDVDKLVVMTFSNAAAAELKQRVLKEITELLEKNPKDKNLRRQQILLDSASISTVHSFCLDIIRNNFDKIGITPDFRIADEAELKVMKNEVLERVVNRFYNEDNNGLFKELSELLSTGNDDKKLFFTVMKLYDFIRSHPFEEDWLNEKLSMYESVKNVTDTKWCKKLLEYARDCLIYASQLCKTAIEMMNDEPSFYAVYGETFLLDLKQIDAILEKADNYKDLKDALMTVNFTNLKQFRACDDLAKKEQLQNMRKSIKTMILDLRDNKFSCTEQEFLSDILYLSPKISKLFSLVTEFKNEFSKAKISKKMMDFSDIEHFALDILIEKTAVGYKKTKLAENLSRQYVEVLVDEYQDTNEAQDMLFRAVSNNETNLFMVGDVKQSIYGFRQAQPEIFMRKKENFTNYPEKFPCKIILDSNFRSRNGVTGFVNYVFSQVMSKQIGEIVYDESEKLTAAASYPEIESAQAHIHIVEVGDENEEASAVLEARHISNLINELLITRTVTQNNETRPIKQSDICILLRSVKNKIGVFTTELINNGLNVKAENSGEFFACREISIMVSLLKVISNPTLDVPLASVMLSEMYCFTPDEVLEIREENKKVPLYVGVLNSVNIKAIGLVKDIDTYSKLATIMRIDDLVRYIYDKSGIINIVSAMKNGAQRRANLNLFLKYASKFDKLGYKGLTGFVRFIERIEETDNDLGCAAIDTEFTDAITIMSIHKSKGLEFPVCILADCSHLFNRQDINDDTLLHSELGFATVRREKSGLVKYNTIIGEALKLELERSSLSEELRVLYVAMTRAKEHLYMTMAVKDARKKIANLASALSISKEISPYIIRKTRSYADWLILASLRHPDAVNLRVLAEMEIEPINSDGLKLSCIINRPEANVVEEKSEVIETKTLELNKDILDRIEYKYNYIPQTKLQSKYTATQLSKKASVLSTEVSIRRPSFVLDEGLTPAERGTVIHKFMQLADIEKIKIDINSEIKRLIAKKYMTETETQNIDIMKIKTLMSSKLGDLLLSDKKIFKEFRFIDFIDAKYFDKDIENGEKVILQGVVDCIIINDEGITIIDYKTDKVKDIEILGERYKKQLELYSKTVEKRFGKKVSKKIIYSFHLNQYIEL